ncbi:MAG: DUF1294 domain-containing protein [Woeseiaceae bacterium]|nr:DUF1294 domain-containing protein [Woeseiaceae bacterium]
MRDNGKIADWNDDKGYGFIAPTRGGSKVFVHIKAFKNRSRRPIVGDKVAYSKGRDETGRSRAIRAVLAGDKLGRDRKRHRAIPAFLFPGLFLVAVGASVAANLTHPWILIVYLAISVLTFIVYAIDKSAAQSGRWRTNEGTLHILALAGGWPGAWIAQQTLRHKSRKVSFRVVFWATVLLNCAGLIWLHTSDGQARLEQLLETSITAKYSRYS